MQYPSPFEQLGDLMKKLLLLCLGALFFVSAAQAEELKIGIVNVKTCVEKSRYGQDEKNTFDAMKKQMTESLEKSDKELQELAKKTGRPRLS